jgi:hypothetical protein
LAGAAQERQDRFVAPGESSGNETLDQQRIESRGQTSRDAAAKLSTAFADGLVATGEPVGER